MTCHRSGLTNIILVMAPPDYQCTETSNQNACREMAIAGQGMSIMDHWTRAWHSWRRYIWDRVPSNTRSKFKCKSMTNSPRWLTSTTISRVLNAGAYSIDRYDHSNEHSMNKQWVTLLTGVIWIAAITKDNSLARIHNAKVILLIKVRCLGRSWQVSHSQLSTTF